mmetsp:Transcript_4542/g.7104  ORF Transcript_4542/g.7104 Transcript_4542/m.7104 type:complete len:216 (-) Transcript_4542:4277-4924(-)
MWSHDIIWQWLYNVKANSDHRRATRRTNIPHQWQRLDLQFLTHNVAREVRRGVSDTTKLVLQCDGQSIPDRRIYWWYDIVPKRVLRRNYGGVQENSDLRPVLLCLATTRSWQSYGLESIRQKALCAQLWRHVDDKRPASLDKHFRPEAPRDETQFTRYGGIGDSYVGHVLDVEAHSLTPSQLRVCQRIDTFNKPIPVDRSRLWSCHSDSQVCRRW